MITDDYGQVHQDYESRDFSAGVPRFEVGRITQLVEPHKFKALETLQVSTDTGVCKNIEEVLQECETNLNSAQASLDRSFSSIPKQVGGDYYTKLKIQPMEYSMANNLNACQHTAIKYITRYKDKAGIEDLQKAIHTIEMLLEFESRAKND